MPLSRRRSSRPRRAGLRPALAVERLSDRCLLSVVTLGAATETDYRTVAVNYKVQTSTLRSLTMNVYRSSSPQPGAGDQVAIGSVNLSGADVTQGEHDRVPLVLG